ncbi:MAG: SWIM zinc finger family protein [Cyanobacteria bacterium J06629_19]
MGVAWTSEQVLALSPDAGFAKRGRLLASPSKWAMLGQSRSPTPGASPRAAWGECKGSGKKPYRTIIDLDVDLGGPAFRCSCPSRKFPCKHAIALFLLYAEQASSQANFTQSEPPSWGSEWLAKREQIRKQSKQQTAGSTAKTSLDPTEQAQIQEDQRQKAQKRLAKRDAKVAAGLEDLDQWLQDIMRRGLAELPSEPYHFWDQTAARLIDAQAPGLARRVRELAGIPYADYSAAETGGWPERMLKALGQLHLLVQSYRRLDQLSPAMQAEVRSQIGFTQTKDDLYQRAQLSGPMADPLVHQVHDTWQVLGKVVTEEESLKTQRVWLWGMESQKAAMVLSFAHGRRQPLDASLVTGACFDGKLIFYPGTGQQETGYRALVTERITVPEVCRNRTGDDRIETAIARYAQALSQNPWLFRAPLILAQVLLRYGNDRWWLQDSEQKTLPLSPAFSQGWEILAMSGGRALAVFGEWNGETLLPLSVWSENKFMALEA